jgi:hypothetical protein
MASPVVWQGPKPAGHERIEVTLEALYDLTPALKEERARQWLTEYAYYWPKLSWRGDTLEIDAGPEGIPGRINVVPDSAAGAPCRVVFKQTLRGRTDQSAIHDAMQAMVDDMVTVGRPYTQVRLLGLDITQAPEVHMTVAVYPGPQVFAGALRTGALRTNADVFERETGWNRGVALDNDLIRQSEETVSALPFVSNLDTAKLIAVTRDTADLYLPVQEASGVMAGGLLGYVPSSSSTDGYWAGELNIQLQSPFGGGRSIGLSASRPDPFSRRTHFNFWEPWPWGAPVWLGVDFGQDDYARDFIETNVALRIRLAAQKPGWEFSASWGKVTTEEDPSPTTFPGERIAVGLAVSDSTPHSAYRFDMGWNRQRLSHRDTVAPPQDVISHTQGGFSAHRWFTLSRSFHTRLLSMGAGTLVGSGFVPQQLLYRIGGIHTFRGYREEQFLVRDFLRLGWEGHLGSLRQSVFLFVEAAWLNFQTEPDVVLSSAGLGLRIARRFQILVGVPSQGGLEQTKIHIGLTTGR